MDESERPSLPDDEDLDDTDAVRVATGNWEDVGVRLTGTRLTGDGLDIQARSLRPTPNSVMEVIVDGQVVAKILLAPEAQDAMREEEQAKREQLRRRIDEAHQDGLLDEDGVAHLERQVDAGRLQYATVVLDQFEDGPTDPMTDNGAHLYLEEDEDDGA